MALFKDKETGKLVSAYQYTGDNKKFIERMLKEKQSYDEYDIAMALISVKPGDHIIPNAYDGTLIRSKILKDEAFKLRYEAHMIEPDEE